jgi:prophage regulatory protein
MNNHKGLTERQTGPDRILRLAEVMRRTGISRTTIWRLESRGLFPLRLRVALRGIGWSEVAVAQWIGSRPTVATPPSTL